MKYCPLCKSEIPEEAYIKGFCFPHYEQLTDYKEELDIIKERIEEELSV